MTIENTTVSSENTSEMFGASARFIDTTITFDGPPNLQPGFLEWHGYPEVIGVNTDNNGIIGNLAGVLIEPETAVLVDLVDEKILRTGPSFNIAVMNDLQQTKDSKRDAEIMALYQRLVNELLKQYYKVAG